MVGKRLLASRLRPVARSATHPRRYLLLHKGGLGLGRVLAGARLIAPHFWDSFLIGRRSSWRNIG